MFEVGPTDERDAREIVSWQYSHPYDLYSVGPDDDDAVASFADPANGYRSVRDEGGELVAFLCFGAEARVDGGEYPEGTLDVGCGIRPDLTGQGMGPAIIRLAIDVGTREYDAVTFRATIAAFNERAQKAAGKAGFVPVSSFQRPSDGLPFVILERPAEAGTRLD